MKKRILVVDDEKDNAEVFRIALEDTELFEVDTFTDPVSAISSPIHMILSSLISECRK